MSFGTLFKTEDDTKEFLKDTYDALRDVLDKMKGKLEFGLKVNWDRDAVLKQIEEENEEIRRLKEEITAELQDAPIASRSNKVIGDKMIMNAAFLVQREKAQSFDQQVQEIGKRY